jgi:hypothetical protein
MNLRQPLARVVASSARLSVAVRVSPPTMCAGGP